MLFAQLEKIEEKLPKDPNTILMYVGGAVGVLVLLFVLRAILRGRKTVHNPEKGLKEKLVDYPPAPAAGSRRLKFKGLDVRVRFIAVAPTGKQNKPLNIDDLADYLNDIVTGLGSFVKTDKPRTKVWPPQLSVSGFGPTFFRLVTSPDAKGTKSHWILAAGQARSGDRLILLGMALYSETPVKIGQVQLDTEDWADSLRVEK